MGDVDDTTIEEWARLQAALKEEPLGRSVIAQLRSDPEAGAESLAQLLEGVGALPSESSQLATIVAAEGSVDKLVNIAQVVNVDAKRVRNTRMTIGAVAIVTAVLAGGAATTADLGPFSDSAGEDVSAGSDAASGEQGGNPNSDVGPVDTSAGSERAEAPELGPPVEVEQNGFLYEIQLERIEEVVENPERTAPPGHHFIQYSLVVTNLSTDRSAPFIERPVLAVPLGEVSEQSQCSIGENRYSYLYYFDPEPVCAIDDDGQDEWLGPFFDEFVSDGPLSDESGEIARPDVPPDGSLTATYIFTREFTDGTVALSDITVYVEDDGSGTERDVPLDPP